MTDSNSYFIDVESSAELSRLIGQHRLFSQMYQGAVWPELPPEVVTRLEDVLDVSCGPGGWVLDVARQEHKRAVGIDLSESMIEYAQVQAREMGLENSAQFRVMDATQPLQFPDAIFDLVNIRFLVGFLPRRLHDRFFSEVVRLLRPGGVLRITESELGYTSSPALERFAQLLIQSLKAAGHGAGVPGPHMGMLLLLPHLLCEHGFEQIARSEILGEYSAGSPLHAGFYEDWKAAYKLSQPFFLEQGSITQAEVDELYEQMLSDMRNQDFLGFYDLVTYIGYKPEQNEANHTVSST
ncbi:hypothetical protein KSF_086780 [Reticulibacter mediterranei]|uniref:Methyltransferase domain-containing protein n=1 Tax=Reticulibacter mediterranei TaxID=2778369 RepID=A0A8J3IU92_9CHLR|nr:class I SAM-dependent methyltransferase [Reticulibacter mediterranei]GHO98630.1 hypothetical protein KSF_086780 [Reticulibacter mediterranei]